MPVAFSHGPREQEKLFARCSRKRQTEALIAWQLARLDAVVCAAEAHATPVLFIDRLAKGARISYVQIGTHTGSVEAAHDLLEHGYRRVAVVTGLANSFDAQQRLAAHRQTIQRASVPVIPWAAVAGRVAEESGYAITQDWLKNNCSLPDTLFASNDATALGTRRASEETNCGCWSLASMIAKVRGIRVWPQLMSRRGEWPAKRWS